MNNPSISSKHSYWAGIKWIYWPNIRQGIYSSNSRRHEINACGHVLTFKLLNVDIGRRHFKGWVPFQRSQPCEIVIASLERGLLTKERICSSWEQILSFSSRPLFERDLVDRKVNRKSKKSCLPCKNWRKTTKCILTLRYFYLYFRENRVWHVICLLTRQFAQPIRPCILGNTRIQKTYHQIVGYCSKQEEASSSRLRTGLHSDIRELHRIKMLIGAIVSLRKKDEQADLELIFKWRMQNRFGRVIHAWRWQGTQWK